VRYAAFVVGGQRNRLKLFDTLHRARLFAREVAGWADRVVLYQVDAETAVSAKRAVESGLARQQEIIIASEKRPPPPPRRRRLRKALGS